MNVYQSPAWCHNVILAKNKHSSLHDASHTIAKTSINTLSSQDGTMDTYIKLLQEHRVSHLVCATDQAYHTEDLCKSGAKKFFSFFIKAHFVFIITCTKSNPFHSSGSDLSIQPLLGAIPKSTACVTEVQFRCCSVWALLPWWLCTYSGSCFGTNFSPPLEKHTFLVQIKTFIPSTQDSQVVFWRNIYFFPRRSLNGGSLW